MVRTIIEDVTQALVWCIVGILYFILGCVLVVLGLVVMLGLAGVVLGSLM